MVVIHAADNHGNGWPEYEKLVADLWRKGTGHGRFHPSTWRSWTATTP